MRELSAAAKAVTDECVIFAGYKARPRVEFNGTCMNVSRAVWFIAEGDPGDRWVLHTCHMGFEGCINRRHLYLGNPQQNVDDMIAAGRKASQPGSLNPRARLTADQVRAIRQSAAAGAGPSELARAFGVACSTIASIVSRKNWAWLQ